MAIKVADRGRIAPFIVMEVMRAANARAAAGGDVIHLEVGEPSTGAPAAVLVAAKRAIDEEDLGYTEAFGLPVLRQRIAQFYEERYGAAAHIDVERIAVTTGSSGAFILAFLAGFDAGDGIAFAAPGYPGYRNIATALDLKPMPIPCGVETGFQPTAELMERLDQIPDGLILASPANPTGAMVAPSILEELVDWCRAHGVRIIADEIYHGITYGAAAETLLAMDPTAIVINSFSKYFSMTGWRLGWMVMPEDISRASECLSQNIFISPPALSQHAALAVFDCTDELDANVRRYADNRAILLDGLEAAGFGPFAPADGAFYVYAGIQALNGTSPDLCAEMLEKTGVAATPGTDFDVDEGAGFMRFSYAGSTADMGHAVDRIGEWVRNRRD
jgi:aspartate/methionine/tyrosine aminotransferase